MKKYISLLLTLVLLLSYSATYALEKTKYYYDGKWHDYSLPPISLQIRGENVQCTVPPLIFNNSSLVPARAVFEKLGAIVTWDAKKSQVKIVLDDINVLLTINDKNAVLNGKIFKMPVPSKIVNNTTMIPVRFVAEAIGMKVEWKDAERVIKIDRPDININDIQGSLSGSTLRITISSDSIIRDYSSLEMDNNPRVVLDIKGALLKSQNSEFEIKSNYVYRVRVAQYDNNPNITRVVADLRYWTGYTVTLSKDKKQIYIDFNNDPVGIDNIRLSKSGSSDKIDIDMKYSRTPVIPLPDNSGKVIVDVPLASVDKIQKNIPVSGNLVTSIECVQLNSYTARLIINTSTKCLLEVDKKAGGALLTISSPVNRIISYDNSTHPQIIMKNERISFNYFNYKNRIEGNNCIVTVPSSMLDINMGRIYVNDSSIDCIDVTGSNSDSYSDIIIRAKKSYKFKISSITDANEVIVDAFPDDGTENSAGAAVNQKIKEKLVVIDPGHGGDETGATYPTDPPNAASIQVKEKDLNLDISLKLYEMLKSAGINVQMTHNDDRNMDLYDRGDFANKANASLLISVHNNSGNSSQNGSMTLFYPTVYDSVYGISGERVAQIVQEEMLKGLGTNDDGIWKRPRLALLNNARMPAIIAEVSYVSNEADRQRLLTDSFRKKAAQALYTATIRSLNEMVAAENVNTSTPVNNTGTVTTNVGNYMPEDFQPRNINGFIVPPKASSKCDYNGGSTEHPSIFDFTIKLDYLKELSKISTVDEQCKEARQALLSKLDEETVNKIMETASQLKDYDSCLWEDEIDSKDYYIQVRCLRYTGIATIDLQHK